MHAAVLAVAYARTGSVDGYAFQSLDCGEFYSIALNVAEHGAFSQSERPPLVPDFWRTPGYPLFLAALMLLFGKSPVVLVLAQQVLSILNVWLLFGIARQSMSERRAALAGLLFLLEPYHLYYSLWLMSTTLFVTVLLLAWSAWQRALKTRTPGSFGSVGALAGFLVLVRPVAILFPLAVLGGLVVVVLRRPGNHTCSAACKKPWAALLAYGASCLAVVGSWMLRNEIVAGYFALSDQGGVVLAYFKATEVELWRQERTAERYLETTLDPTQAGQPHRIWETIDGKLRARFPDLPEEQRASLRWQNLAQGNKTSADSFEVSRALRRIGLSYLLASPISTITCCMVRCAGILTFPLNLAFRPPVGVPTDHLRSLTIGLAFSALCVGVVVRLLRGRLNFAGAYLPLAGTLALLLATTPQLDPRFRVPMIPLLVFVALLPRAVPSDDLKPPAGES